MYDIIALLTPVIVMHSLNKDFSNFNPRAIDLESVRIQGVFCELGGYQEMMLKIVV